MYPFDDLRSRRACDKRQVEHTSARRFDLFTADNLIEAPIAAFDEHIWQESSDHCLRRDIIKDRHIIHATERRYNFCPFLLIENWTRLALQFTHGTITVERHDQHVAEFARLLKVTHMARMQEIEAAISEDHNAPCTPQ